MTFSIVLTVAIRYLLVVLFFPFSALDKTLNFRGAVAQAREMFPAEGAARAVILAGLFVEIVMPLAILTGYGDRIAAFILAGYCGVTDCFALEAVLETRRLLASRPEPSTRSVLGFHEEFFTRGRISSHRPRHDCGRYP